MKGKDSGRRGAIRGAVFGFALIAVGLSSAPLLAESCARPEDQMALNARVLQTELMVGALTCDNQLLYNEFVRKYRAELVRQGKSLQEMFRRRHGSSASSHLNALVTRLANEASQRSMAQRVGFCRQSALLFAEALNGEKPDLAGLIQTAAGQGVGGLNTCGSKAGTVAGFGTAAGKATLSQQKLPTN